MIIVSFNNRIAPKKIGPINEQLAYGLLLALISGMFVLITESDITLRMIFSVILLLALWRCYYVSIHMHDWFLRFAKSSSKEEMGANQMVKSEL